MPQIRYHIDKALSNQKAALVLRVDIEGIQNANAKDIKNCSNESDKNFISWVQSFESPLIIPYSKSLDAIERLIPTGRIFLNGKNLVPNLYSKWTLEFIVEADKLTPILKNGDKQLFLQECEFLCTGRSHWFVKGINLQIIDSEISWKELIKAYQHPEQLDVDEVINNYPVIFKDNAQEVWKQKTEPTPILKLTDRTGAFANLCMDYGNGKVINKNEICSENRLKSAEDAWEKDLLETDFIKKKVGTSDYFCPLDKVVKSLSFLLELGWTIFDYRNQQVIKQDSIQLNFQTDPSHIIVNGQVKFATYEANIKDVIGTFNRKEKFVQLTSGTVGLLTDDQHIKVLCEESELIQDQVRIVKQRIGSLEELLANPAYNKTFELTSLQEQLKNVRSFQEIVPSQHFSGHLRPYQLVGLNWLNMLADQGLHGILADDMGLGKTVQVLAFLSTRPTDSVSLIVLPTSLLFNWQQEIQKFLPTMPLHIHHGSQRSQHLDKFPTRGIVLSTYATVRNDCHFLSKISFDCLFLDEAQAIKNADTQINQAIKLLQAGFRLCITGTPLENRLNELWAQFNFLMPGLLGNEQEFAAEIQAAESDSRYLKRIKRITKPFILRRRKEEVAPDLPERIEQTVWLEMHPSQRQAYEQFLSGIKNNLIKKISIDGIQKHRIEVLEAILRLRQLCCHPGLIQQEHAESIKIDFLLEELSTILSEGCKVLVYSQFTSMLTLVKKALSEKNTPFVYLDGQTRDRAAVVSQFQNDPQTAVFLISLKAGGIGLNLTAADYVILLDPWWNDAVEQQAIDRAHRIGRQNSVIAKRYIIRESIEEKIMQLKAKKQQLVDELFDEDTVYSKITLEDFLSLLNP